MTTPLEFVGGDDVIEPFLIEKTDGTIQDLTGTYLSGVVAWRGRNRITLSVGSELLITNMAPARAVVDADQIPHGHFRLTELQTILIPEGQIALLRLTVVEGGVTMSTYNYPLKRVS